MTIIKVIIQIGRAGCSGMSTQNKSIGFGAPVGGVVGSVLAGGSAAGNTFRIAISDDIGYVAGKQK